MKLKKVLFLLPLFLLVMGLSVSAQTNVARGKTVTVSSIEGTGYDGNKAVDGNLTTRWASIHGIDPQWIYVDLGESCNIDRVKLTWEAAYASAYKLQVSDNTTGWTDIYSTTGGNGGTDDLTGLSGSGRYLRVYGTARATSYGYSLFELEVYAQKPVVLYGDVNTDGAINIVDSLVVAQYYVGLEPPIQLAAADVNCDGAVNIIDALLIAQLYVGIIPAFPCTTPTPPPGIGQSDKVILTSEAGDKLAEKPNITFSQGIASGVTLEIYPDRRKQTIEGIGSSFTESSAFVLATLSNQARADIIKNAFGAEGANFSLNRTHIGSCDFSVQGKYSYQNSEWESFSLYEDEKGFSRSQYPDIMDEKYDLLPFIKEALAINPTMKIIASPWTAPPWMKNGGTQGGWFGGSLSNYQAFANYIDKYIQEIGTKGVPIWGITPENEPLGNGSSWESMQLSEHEEADLIANYLGAKMRDRNVKILMYDQNRDSDLGKWADAMYNSAASQYVYGTAVHWYSNTVSAMTGNLDYVHNSYPDKAIIHSEGCIDALGDDPDQEPLYSWWKNDNWWWNVSATDWGFRWGNPADHPKYVPVHRYARNIIDSLNHWMSGWVDWNVVLDKRGGPNHVCNFCGAPIMVDTATKEVYYTPVYYTLAQLSKTIRPGDQVVEISLNAPGLNSDALHATATINSADEMAINLLNTTKQDISLSIQIGSEVADITLEANSLKSIQITL